MGKRRLPFRYQTDLHEGYVTIFCENRQYGIQEILVPRNFWPEGKFLLKRIWGAVNPGIYTAGFFQNIEQTQVFHFSPLTSNVSRTTRALRGIIDPVFAASRSIKCLVVWPEMIQWRSRDPEQTTGGAQDPLKVDSPVRYLLEAMRGNEISAVPFGNGPMIPDHKAALSYLAHAM